ncbi:response regulator transcription factor [Streptomyces scabiei]|uniref:response regulator transcription factor n=1 Tax=Streptomyces scabiei TaxID=1930 RepID=UPI001B3206C2|nr:MULTISPECIES: response regulator transcription factor [Streptomyces]MBP5883135.1 response regulator transcription factor [Streptomyces sp. LBUM 1487]MDX2628625.1 response regulator transcription factor [Streptomyces scabiei]MDX3162709.1 response regulator transcription factor [Streptomyces scabiei]
MSEIRDRLLRLMLDSADRHDIPLSVRQLNVMASDVARDFEPPTDIPVLTVAERQALIGLVLAETAAESGRRLFVTEDTVRQQRVRLYRKLGVTCAAEAVAFGRRRGLLVNEPLATAAGVSA